MGRGHGRSDSCPVSGLTVHRTSPQRRSLHAWLHRMQGRRPSGSCITFQAKFGSASMARPTETKSTFSSTCSTPIASTTDPTTMVGRDGRRGRRRRMWSVG
jgi:hypothetical protein